MMRRLTTLVLPLVFPMGCAMQAQPSGTPATADEQRSAAAEPAVEAVERTAHPAAAEDALPTPHGEPIYDAVLVPEGGKLSVRDEPGWDSPVVEELPPFSSRLTGTGHEARRDGERWVEILLPTQSRSGWVPARLLSDSVDPARFCEQLETGPESAPSSLLVRLDDALAQGAYDQLAELASPVRGLRARYVRSGPAVHYGAEELASTPSSLDQDETWGQQDDHAAPVTGSFADVIGDDLRRVMEDPETTAHCNRVVTPPGATIDFPTEYVNLNLVSLHHPGSAGHGDIDWVTWVLAVDYADGEPHLVALERFAH